jgi:hypothetical protein
MSTATLPRIRVLATGGIIGIAEGYRHGPRVDKGSRWDPAEVGAVVADLIAAAPKPAAVYGVS